MIELTQITSCKISFLSPVQYSMLSHLLFPRSAQVNVELQASLIIRIFIPQHFKRPWWPCPGKLWRTLTGHWKVFFPLPNLSIRATRTLVACDANWHWHLSSFSNHTAHLFEQTSLVLLVVRLLGTVNWPSLQHGRELSPPISSWENVKNEVLTAEQ